MHQVTGDENQEVMAFVASTLSYGSRKAFMPKIQEILDASGPEVCPWVLRRGYVRLLSGDDECFYRFYTRHSMLGFLDALREMIIHHGSLKKFVNSGTGKITAMHALTRLCEYFSTHGDSGIIPKDTSSSCKRLCMFLRWMVRDESPVDLGLWSDIVDKRSLIIPLDTHVLTVANRLGLIATRSASMATALRLTESLDQVFPDDPARGDFALYGYHTS